MKNVLVMMVVLAASAFAQTGAQQSPPAGTPQAQPQQAQPGQAQPGQAQLQQKKEIKDQAEYSAYMAALNQTEPAARASAFEAFLQQYPNTVMKPEALEYMMAGYNQAANPQKTIEAATRLLEVDSTNLGALGILADYERKLAQSGQDPQANLAKAQQHAQAGMQAMQTRPKPEGMSDADYQRLRQQLAGIFNGALGIAALQSNNYPDAQKGLRTAAEVSPKDYTLVYPLALAYLRAPQPDYINGLFFLARAADLASTQVPQMQQQLLRYGESQYQKYHGSSEGWDQVLAAAKASNTPPADFTIKPAPTPAEQAGMLVQSKPVNQMSFGEFVMIFTSGNQQATDTVWNQIKDKPLAIEGQVISATATKIMIAATLDDIAAKKPDIQLDMAAPLTRALVPKEGATIQFEGTPTSYTAEPPTQAGAQGAPTATTPNFLMVMSKGVLLTKAGKPAAPAKTPARRPATRRRPPAA